jgi:hypothetical protein
LGKREEESKKKREKETGVPPQRFLLKKDENSKRWENTVSTRDAREGIEEKETTSEVPQLTASTSESSSCP